MLIASVLALALTQAAAPITAPTTATPPVTSPAKGEAKISDQTSSASSPQVSGQPAMRWNLPSESKISSTDPSAWGSDEALVRAFIDEAVAQGGTVAMRTTFSGTMTGPFDGHSPNGRSMKVSFQLFGHVRNGRICELWEEYDVAGMRRQLGIDS